MNARGRRMLLRMAVRDMKCGIRRTWPAGAAVILLYAVYWVFGAVAEAGFVPSDRVTVMYFLSMFFSFSVPSAVYGHINDPAKGVEYVMLPVSVRSKFAVMVAVAVIAVPGCMYAVLYLIDSVLAAVGNGHGFSGMIWNGPENRGVTVAVSDFAGICACQSLFLLGNIVLRKHKIAVTLLVFMALHGAAALVPDVSGPAGRVFRIAYTYLLPVCMWTLAYRMFRNIRLY